MVRDRQNLERTRSIHFKYSFCASGHIMPERLSFSAVRKGQQTLHWTFGVFAIDWFVCSEANLPCKEQQGAVLDWAIDKRMQSTWFGNEDKFHPEKERRYLDFDCDEIQQYGGSESWVVRNDKKKAHEGNTIQ